MRRTRTPVATRSAVAAAVTVLALAGCGSDSSDDSDAAQGEEQAKEQEDAAQEDEQENEPQGVVFDFQTLGIETAGPGEAITVVVPDDARDAAKAGALPVDSFQVTAHELDTSEQCAVDLTIDYADGSADTLAAPSPTKEEAESAGQEDVEALFASFDVTSADELVALLEDVSPSDPIPGDGGEEHNRLKNILYRGDSPLTPEEGVNKTIDVLRADHMESHERSASESEEERLAKRLGLDDPQPISELDESDPDSGTYFADDHSTATIVQDCAAFPADEDAAEFVYFPKADKDEDDRTSWFAGFWVAGMTDGTVSVFDGKVSGWTRDSNDNWISS